MLVDDPSILLREYRLDEELGVVLPLGDLDPVDAEDVLLEGAVLDEAVAAVRAHVLLLARVRHTVVPADGKSL